MFLVFLTLSCVLLASSALDYEIKCYGGEFRIPFDYSPPLYKGPLYLTPSKGGPKRLLMDNGEAKDPRLKVSHASALLTDLKKSDDGTLSVSLVGSIEYNIIRLQIRDCARIITKYYGSVWEENVPSQAAFLEFDDPHQAKILWNRTDPQANKSGRGQMKRNVWRMSDLTQADNGYYNFRKKDNTVHTRLRLEVNENYENYDRKVKESLVIDYPQGAGPWDVTFKPKEGTKSRTVMKAGRLVTEEKWFIMRIQDLSYGLEIDRLETTDSGHFEFRDPQGNMALSVMLEVEEEPFLPPALIYISVPALVIFGVLLCCCCYCCKKKRSKRQSTPQTAAAPAMYYHEVNQGPMYSMAPSASSSSRQPVVSTGPTNTSPKPTVYHPVNVHVNPSQPEVAPPGGQRSAPAFSISSEFLSSDYEPRFELKGLSIPSAPPLSSDRTFSDVYHSDKLNF